ncbi:MAG: choice-of-anchor Q domain-containing protein [Gemmataceae bacterium]
MSAKSRRPIRPRLTQLEDRTVPAVFTVTTGTDVVNPNDGLTSLREAVTLANATAGADSITFAAGVNTCTITAATLSLTETGTGNATTIAGGTTGVTVNRDINAANFFAVFTVATDAKAIFRNLTISGGAGTTGGGIQNNGAIEVIGCTLTNNNATTTGGAIYSSGLFPSYVINSTISGNTSSGAGGGIEHDRGDLNITNSTIVKNVSDAFGFNPVLVLGGGLHTTGQATVIVNNTIFADNLALTTPNDIDGAVGAASFNNIVTSAAAGGMTILNANKVGVASASFLAPTLANNGGPTQTHLILAGSAAVNAGRAADAVDANNAVLTTDQRGLPRMFGAEVDIGAVELQTANPNPNPNPNPGGGGEIFALGAGPGGAPIVRIIDTATRKARFEFAAFNQAFVGGVNVATGGDITGDGQGDFVVAAGSGGGPHVKVYDGVTGRLFREFFAYDAAFTGGVNVAFLDMNGDGLADIVTGAGAGGGPHVKVFSGKDNSLLANFFAYDTKFTGGVSVGAGDLNGDALPEVVTGAGAGGGPHVRAFDLLRKNAVVADFFAYDPAFRGGINVAVADVNNDGQEDILTAPKKGGVPVVRAFDGRTTRPFQTITAFDSRFLGGVNIAAADTNNDGVFDILVGAGPGGGPHVRSFRGTNGTVIDDSFAFSAAFTGGVTVG